MKRYWSLLFVIMALITSQQVNAQIVTCKFCGEVIREKNHMCKKMRDYLHRQNQAKSRVVPVLEKEVASGPHKIVITYGAQAATIEIDDSLSYETTNNSFNVPELKKGKYEIILINEEKIDESHYLLNQKADDIYKEAESLEKNGRKEEARRKYKEAFVKYKEAAEKGNRDAQYSLAFQYHTGKGTDVNMNEALKWYTESANNGRASAQKVLGTFYLEGDMGLNKDVNRGMELLGRAAANYSKNADSGKEDQILANQTYDLMIEEIEKMEDKESNEYRDSIVSDLINSSRKAIIANDLENALALLNKGMKLQENNPYFISYNGMLFLLNGENETAYDYYKKNGKQYKARLLEDLEMFEKEMKNMTTGCKKQLEQIKKILVDTIKK